MLHMLDYESQTDAFNNTLNPKIMTRRITPNSAREDSLPKKQWEVTQNRSSDLRRLRSGSDAFRTFSPHIIADRESAARSRRSSIGTSNRRPSYSARSFGEPSSRPQSARRYAHVPSVVRELIDSRITPLEAQHGPSLRRQRARSGEAPPNARRTFPAPIVAPRRASQEMRRGSPPSPKEETMRGNAAAPDSPRPAAAPRRHTTITAFDYASIVVDKMANARVRADHVPRCAEAVPRRFKCPPPESAGDGARPSPPRRRSATPNARRVSLDSVKHADADGAARGRGIQRGGAVPTARAASSFVGVGARSNGNRTSTKALDGRQRYASKLPKRLEGYERVMLFEMDPPVLAA